MKKNGFTLAEVLVTLAIIGVVATLTLPSLMSNTQEQQAVTGFRKAMNTLNEVAQMNAAVDGFDYSSITQKTSPGKGDVYSDGVLDQSIWGMMASKAQVNVAASNDGKIDGECKGMDVIFFRDGTALCYNSGDTTSGANDTIEAVVDTNSRKAPNLASECKDEVCTPSGKAIRDQFVITLRGATAIPGKVTVSDSGVMTEGEDSKDYAARWAMSK